ncbi:MAG: DUF2442 domain-containing protein [Burkholderiaceae bacterium]
MDIADDAIAAARKVGKALGPRVVSARYLRASNKLEVGYENDVTLRVPVALIQELALRDTVPSAAELSSIEIWGDGYDIHFPRLDALVHGPALLKGILGTQSWMREHARGLGSSTSAKKAAAARRNGLKGGRPRKQAAPA